MVIFNSFLYVYQRVNLRFFHSPIELLAPNETAIHGSRSSQFCHKLTTLTF